MGILDDLVVVDLSRHIAGPYCTQLLGDMGARVIKVESPRGDDSRAEDPFLDGFSLYFASVNRNKESIAIDMRAAEGRRLVEQLIRGADILVQNYRPGVMEKMGLDWDRLRELNSRLVYVAISGFGREGAYAGLPAFDEVIQAFTGLMDLTGQTNGPPTIVGVPIIDILAGAYAFGATLLGLHEREKTKQGVAVTLDLYGTGLQAVSISLALSMATDTAESRAGNRNRYATGVNAYQTSDGWVHLVGYSDAHWRKMAVRIGGDSLVNDPRFTTAPLRSAAMDQVDSLIAGWLKLQTTATVLEWMAEDGIPCGPLRTMKEVAHDPELRQTGRVVQVEHPSGYPIELVGPPIRVGSSPAAVRKAPPTLGQDTLAVARGLLSLDDNTITDLVSRGVLVPASADTSPQTSEGG